MAVQLRRRQYPILHHVPLCLCHETPLLVVSWARLLTHLEINWPCDPGREVSAGILPALNYLQDTNATHFLGRSLIRHSIESLFVWCWCQFAQSGLQITFVPWSKG